MAGKKQYMVILDVMGADHGPEVIINGGLQAVDRIGDSLQLTLVGCEEQINAVLSKHHNVPDNVSVLHAPSTVPMTISATDGIRMRDSSIAIGLKALKGKEGAFVSPGNTGAAMASSLLTLGRVEGVSRPAICAVFPTSTGRPIVVLDVGANVDCKPHHLSQFAIMGSVYASVMFDMEAPRVGLVSIGEERSKGNELIFGARKLLSDSTINFVGNIEGRDILSGTVDVAVVDGFMGNILLKFAESIKPLLTKSIQRQIQTNIFSRIGATLLLPFLRRLKSQFDYAKFGGAPLLGVNGDVLICHGSSNSTAINNAVYGAYSMVSRGMKRKIHDELETNHFGQNNGSNNKGQDCRDGVVCSTSTTDQR